MRSKITAALAFAGLLMMAIPLTASANDQATCTHKPGWGYAKPKMYRNWRQLHCGGYAYNQNYLGNGGWLPFASGYNQTAPIYAPVAPVYSQAAPVYAPAYGRYQGPRYFNNGAYRAARAHSWRERHFHHDHNHR